MVQYGQGSAEDRSLNANDELDNSSVKSVLSHISTSIRRTFSTLDLNKNVDVSRRRKPKRDILNDKEIEKAEDELDKKRLWRTLRDAGRNADGVSAVEVWILDRSQGRGAHLTQPPGGFWSSPDFIPDDYEALERISDVERDDYEYPHPLLVGTGLAGMLWSEKRDSVEDGNENNDQARNNASMNYSTGVNRATYGNARLPTHVPASPSPFHIRPQTSRGTCFNKSFQSMTNLHATTTYRSVIGESGSKTPEENQGGLAWRDIHSITVDPYQPTFERLALLEEAGFTKSAGIRFDMQGVKGIVLFLAGDDVTEARLNVADNVAYMRAAANLVGAAAALPGHRKILRDGIKKRPDSFQINLTETKGSSKLYRNVTTWLGKCRGGDLQPPPSMPIDEAFLTFCGVFVTLVTLHWASSWIEALTGSGFILGPFGALMTLQYGLTMAPAAQPRNVIYGQITATSIALLLSSILEDRVHKYIKVSLATAIAIATKVVLGIAHPPAGATALIVASGDFDSKLLPPVILSNLIAVILSTFINNLSEKRQYPTYLHFGESYLSRVFFGCCAPEGDLSSITNEKRLIKSASKLLLEANFYHPGDQIHQFNKHRSTRRQYSDTSDTSSFATTISSTTLLRRSPKPDISVNEDDEIGLDVLVNEVSLPFIPYTIPVKDTDNSALNEEEERGYQRPLSSHMKNLPSSNTSTHREKYPQLLAPQRGSPAIEASHHSREASDFDSSQSKRNEYKGPGMNLTYGTMFLMSSSLGDQSSHLQVQETDIDDIGSSHSSDLEELI